MSTSSLLPLSDRPSPTMSSMQSPSLCPFESILSPDRHAQCSQSIGTPPITASLSVPYALPSTLELAVKLSPHQRPSSPLTAGAVTPPPADTASAGTEQLTVYKRPRDDSDDDADPDPSAAECEAEDRREREFLGRFGYKKRAEISKTLQGHIFVAEGGSVGKEVVIKKTSKALHRQHVTVQNGRRFGIYENILKECILLRHLTEHRGGLIMTSFAKFDAFLEDADAYYLAMEHGGADLFDFILEGHELIQCGRLRIKEWRKFTKYLFWQLVVVTQWLHSAMGVAHLDLSLENMLIAHGAFVDGGDGQHLTISPAVQIKLCDFGLAEVFPLRPASGRRDFRCSKFCGKTNYKAPEVFSKRGVFDARKADVWSLGVVLFCMLVGSPPYNKPTEGDQAFVYIRRGLIDQLLFQWERNHFITVKVLSLLHSMLDADAESRFLMDDVVQHSWLSLYYQKYRGQMAAKAKLQRRRNRKAHSKPLQLPYYRLPADALPASGAVPNISH